MRYCRSCGIFFQVPADKCMFCSNDTIEHLVPEELAYYESMKEDNSRYVPVTKEKVLKQKFYKLLCIALFVAAGLCIGIDIIEDEEHAMTWSIIIVASGGYIAFCLKLLAAKMFKAKKTIYILILTILELLAIAISIRNIGWFIDFVLPFMIITCVLFSTLLLFGGREKVNDYMIYVFNLSLLGLIPSLLLVLNCVTPKWPSLAAATYCMATLIGLPVLLNRRFIEELKRRTHI